MKTDSETAEILTFEEKPMNTDTDKILYKFLISNRAWLNYFGTISPGMVVVFNEEYFKRVRIHLFLGKKSPLKNLPNHVLEHNAVEKMWKFELKEENCAQSERPCVC